MVNSSSSPVVWPSDNTKIAELQTHSRIQPLLTLCLQLNMHLCGTYCPTHFWIKLSQCRPVFCDLGPFIGDGYSLADCLCLLPFQLPSLS